MYSLGMSYAQGNGVPADPALAAEWWEKAAELGHPMAMNNFGISLLTPGGALGLNMAEHTPGNTPAETYQRGVDFVRRAAALGIPHATQYMQTPAWTALAKVVDTASPLSSRVGDGEDLITDGETRNIIA